LLLGEMRQNFALKLPYRAGKVMPEEVRRLLPAQSENKPENAAILGVNTISAE